MDNKNDFCGLSAWRIVSGIAQREFSVTEVVDFHLKQMEKWEKKLNACITFLPEEALKRAQELDERIAKGEECGLLTGVPLILKDNICTRGIRTTCGSRILEKWIPPYDASVVCSLNEAGAILIGKANMDEFAMGSSTENSAFGPTSNPRDLTKVPGGSSGGSAAAVAAGYCPVALGSDTGGSIRQPAAFCGVQGFKPTYGAVSRYGLIAYASSLDQIGVLCREIADIALTLDTISFPDPKDSTCSKRSRPRFLDACHTDNLKGKRIGILKGFPKEHLDESLQKSLIMAARICQDNGAELAEVKLPLSLEYGLACYYILAPAEASSNLARYDGVRYGLSFDEETLLQLYLKTRGRGFGEEVKRRILTGTYVLSSGYYDAYYRTAQKVRRKIAAEFEEAFKVMDAILMPTTPSLPFKKGEHAQDPIKMYMEDALTLPINLAGLPALSLWTGFTSHGLPTSVQLVGPRFQDFSLLRIAAILEREIGVPNVAQLKEEE